ncbi:MAG: PorV/PorQ family protein, partial [Rhodothermaceae bacterium]
MKSKILINSIKLIIITSIFTSFIYSQKPYRVGTSTANFLEIGYGASATAMGDAFTAVANDVSSIYWNPAGLATLKGSEAAFSVQPWYADINTSFSAVAISLDDIGTVAVGIVAVDYGDMDVTSLDMQDGTGETFSASDISVSVGYGRRLATWFSFGAAAKYISSSIWHTSASTLAFDLGVLINSGFFSPTDNVEDGLNIGMSVSNYGGQMQFDGMDLLQPIDPTPGQNGDYKDVKGQYRLGEWELPLMFRLGVSLNAIRKGNH